ncbi:hypothetical protein CANARDRAFT_9594 [[Candida] arabinofermentans NRRL YB-2248]|uniref:Translation initiation factor eIF2B subunit epsilon n=1 Tax=[Candida] arabinofermentans NRRL YB-2248 TaxID=983967 RepID=A0A1E4SVM0_9ASCO|nr:hypothetical protein CANARDRAFT_9594 [[Candida] arabinofermentans NRRL YB-2248]
MPPKNSKKITGNNDSDEEPKLQAIVLTDCFQTKFMPLTSIKPRCLLPLANVPLIEYTLEFLAQSNVSEVYLMCCSHADQIQQYIDESIWNLSSSPFKKIQTIMSLESRSVGDIMRDVDSRGLITGDFIMVSGDVVTNMDLTKAISIHKQRKLADRDYIATMILKEASELHRARSRIEPACFILDKETDKCLYYQDIPSINGSKTSVNIDPEVLEGSMEFIIRNDLIDCHVDICTPQVPSIFQDNFDYQFLRSDFVKGVLSSDLLKKHIYAYITKEDYAARVESWQTYDGISQDVIERWCYPIVPERNMLIDQTYTYESKHIYKENNVRLSQSCKIQSRVVIGSDTIIGDGTNVVASVIGKNCHIGNNVTLENSYIWDGAKIEDGCIVKHSIVAANAIVKKNAMLNSGSVIGFDVVIDENVIIPNDTKIIKDPVKNLSDSTILSFESSDDESNNDDSEDDESDDEFIHNIKKTHDPSIVGENGIGFLYEDEDDDEEQGFGNSTIIYQLASLNVSDVSIASTTIVHQHRHKKRTTSTVSGYLTEDDEEEFSKEAIATVTRALENNHDIDTALLELNTLRMSMNVTYHEVREATCAALLKRVGHFIETQTLGAKDATGKVFKRWCPLFKRQVFDDDDQVDLLMILQTLCSSIDKTYNSLVFLYALVVLYDEEIVEEENIYKWWDSEESLRLVEVRDKAEKWIEWLREAESDEDDEEEEDE